MQCESLCASETSWRGPEAKLAAPKHWARSRAAAGGRPMRELERELLGLMDKYRFTPKKSLSQNFLVEESVISMLVSEASLKSSDTVLEVGAGTGFLTRELQKKCKVIAYEVDKELCELLSKELPKENLELHCADFFRKPMPEFTKIVSAPPYSNSSELLFRLFKAKFDSGALVLQKEFAERMLAEPGFAEYNALSCLASYFFDSKVVCPVKPQSFYPSPSSPSLILSFNCEKRFGSAANDEKFISFASEIFRFKHKNAKNALSLAAPFLKRFGLEEKKMASCAKELGIADEKLSLVEVEELVELFNSF